MSDGVKSAAGRCANVCRNNYFRVIFSDVCTATAILLTIVTLGASSTTPKDSFSWSKFKLDLKRSAQVTGQHAAGTHPEKRLEIDSTCRCPQSADPLLVALRVRAL